MILSKHFSLCIRRGVIQIQLLERKISLQATSWISIKCLVLYHILHPSVPKSFVDRQSFTDQTDGTLPQFSGTCYHPKA